MKIRAETVITEITHYYTKNIITNKLPTMKQKNQISADTKLKVIAINKITFQEHEMFMTYIEWINLNKSTKFHYKAIKI